MRSRIVALTGCLALAAGLLTPVPGTASTVSRAAGGCALQLGSVAQNGSHLHTTVTADNPPTTGATTETTQVYQPGQVRLSSRFTQVPNIAGADRYGTVVIGNGLYASSYAIDGSNQIDSSYPHTLRRIGGGWTQFSFLEVSGWASLNNDFWRSTAYGLRNDGVLFRWDVRAGWRNTGSYPGFAAVKTMVLISKQPTYDTFLASTRGGALYTIHIPTSAPMKPVVKPLRTRTWQGFEYLAASKCGQYGTLLLGIDRDTGNGYLYAVGHANGTATIINGLGRVTGTFEDNVNFSWVPIEFYDQLNGE